MTVQELIEKLKTFPSESQVVMNYTDITDYHYVTPLNIDDVSFDDDITSDSYDGHYDEETDEFIPEYENVVVITFSE